MDLKNNIKDMWISLMFAMSYVPKNKKMHINGRPQHTFLFVSKGKYIYKFGNTTLLIKEGDVIYIPKGAVYSYEIISQYTYCRQIEFEINNPSFSFVTYPIKLEGIKNSENMFKEIINKFGINTPKRYFEALGNLYDLCAFIPEKETKSTNPNNKIKPAVEYIETHCSEKIYVQHLADICFMSQAQLRRHFQNIYNTSPVSYKNRFRIEKAKQMLLYNVTDIGDISAKLGFDSVYSFSKIFKQYTGYTPSEFSKNKRDSNNGT